MKLRPPEALRLGCGNTLNHRAVGELKLVEGPVVVGDQCGRNNRQKTRVALEAGSANIRRRRCPDKPAGTGLSPGPPANLLGCRSCLTGAAARQHEPDRPPVPNRDHLVSMSLCQPLSSPSPRDLLLRLEKGELCLNVRVSEECCDLIGHYSASLTKTPSTMRPLRFLICSQATFMQDSIGTRC